MGNDTNKQKPNLQLVQNHPKEHNSDDNLSSLKICCCIDAPKQKIVQSNIPKWKINLNKNLQQLMRNEYKWIYKINEVYKVYRKEDNIKFLNELNNIKQKYLKNIRESTHTTNINESDKQQQQFEVKRALQQSVIFLEQIYMINKQKVRNTKISSWSYESILINRTRQTTIMRKRKESLISFIDERILTFSKKQVITKSTSDALSLFIKIIQIIQKHTQDQQCILYQIKDSFIKYIKKVYQYPQTISNQLQKNLNDDINQFLKFYTNTINDYYCIQALEDILQSSFFLFNRQNFRNAITTIIFKNPNVYRIVTNIYMKKYKPEQDYIQMLLKERVNIVPEELDIKIEYWLNEKTVQNFLKKTQGYDEENPNIIVNMEYQPYEKCILKLREIKNAYTPIAKLKLILSCAEMITEAIQQFYNLNNIKVKKKILLDADQVLQIFCYIFIKSQIKSVYTHLKIIQNFTTQIEMMQITGYYFSVLCAAVENLKELGDPKAFKTITFGE